MEQLKTCSNFNIRTNEQEEEWFAWDIRTTIPN